MISYLFFLSPCMVLINIVHITYGRQDFHALRLKNEESLFVDKSLLIKEIVDSKTQGIAVLITRPSKFGKTVNLDMLERFFKIPDNKYEEQLNKNLFYGGTIQVNGTTTKTLRRLEIINYTDTVDGHFGKYPVVSLSFKGCNVTSADSLAKSVSERILEFTRERGYKVRINFTQPTNASLYNLTGNQEDIPYYNFHIVKYGLEHLSKYMYESYYNKVVILIDDYDYPLYEAYRVHGAESEQFLQIHHLLVNMVIVTVDDKYIEQIIITGVMPLGLDWDLVLKEYTVLDEKLSAYFGFTEDEVNRLLDSFPAHQTKKTDVKNYYNGYLIGGRIMYNTVSIPQCLKHDGSVRTYWKDDEILKPLDDLPTNSTVMGELNRFLCSGENRMETFKKKLFRYNLKTTQDTFTYLLYTGYVNAVPLKKIPERYTSLECECSIPGLEIKEILHNKIADWINKKLKLNRTDLRNEISEYLIQLKFDDFEELGKDIFRIAAAEKLYSRMQHYYLDTFETLITGKLVHERFKYVDAASNEERVCVIFVSNSTAVIVEVQMAKDSDAAMLTTKAVKGLRQIKKARYDLKLKKNPFIRRIAKLAVVFGGEKVELRYLVEKRNETHPGTFEWIDVTGDYSTKPKQTVIASYHVDDYSE